MSDLTERLRNCIYIKFRSGYQSHDLGQKAADEIDRLTAALAEARDKALEEAATECVRHARSELPFRVWNWSPFIKGGLYRTTRSRPRDRAKAFIRAATAIRALKEKP